MRPQTLCDGEVVRRAALRSRGRAGRHPLHVDPAELGPGRGELRANLGPIVRDPSVLIGNYCSYVDVHDLCEAVLLAIETDLPGHEVFYVAAPDTIGGHPLAETVRTHYGGAGIEIRPLAREDASGVSSAKAERMLGWRARARGATTWTARVAAR